MAQVNADKIINHNSKAFFLFTFAFLLEYAFYIQFVTYYTNHNSKKRA